MHDLRLGKKSSPQSHQDFYTIIVFRNKLTFMFKDIHLPDVLTSDCTDNDILTISVSFNVTLYLFLNIRNINTDNNSSLAIPSAVSLSSSDRLVSMYRNGSSPL